MSILLRAVYQTAVRYGFAYDTPQERYYILLLLSAALTRGPERAAFSRRADDFGRSRGPRRGTVVRPGHPDARNLRSPLQRHAGGKIHPGDRHRGGGGRRVQLLGQPEGHRSGQSEVSEAFFGEKRRGL
ncbi:MAG: EcsC family protein [Intestinimonas sp.]